jgi:hypothetical protein
MLMESKIQAGAKVFLMLFRENTVRCFLIGISPTEVKADQKTGQLRIQFDVFVA